MAPMNDITPDNIDALLALHRETFGSARMEDEAGAGDPPAGDPPAEDPPAGETPPEGEPKPDEKPGLTPEQAMAELTRVRAEAANWRTQFRAAEKALTEAKTPEEHAAAVAELQQKNADLEMSLMRSTVAREFELPEVLAKRLTGATEAELKADAKELAKLIVAAPPEHLGGGLTPDDGDDGEMDPGALARKHSTRR